MQHWFDRFSRRDTFQTGALWIALALILGLAAALRFVNLAHNPGWYTDEGTHLEIARHLQHGRFQYLAISQSTLLFAKLPFFELLLALAVRLWGVSMLTLRSITAACGVATVVMLYLLARRLHHGHLLPLLAALLLAIYPQAVLYSRFGFSYNLLAPLLLSMLYCLISYSEDGGGKWLVAASVLLGLGILSDLWMVSLLPVLLLAVLLQRGQDFWWSLLLALLPFMTYAALSLITMPDAFLFDLRFTLFRLNTQSLPGQVGTLAGNVTTLMTQDGWLALGMAGLLLDSAPHRRLLPATFFLPLLVLGRTTALHGLSFYYMIPLLPLAALGLAKLVMLVWARMSGENKRGRLGATLFLVLFALLIAGNTLWLTGRQVRQGWKTAIDPFLLAATDAEAAAAWVNGRVQPDEVIIASPGLAWLLAGQPADFQMAVAATGVATPHLPPDIPAERFIFDPAFARACYVVVDNLWSNWALFHIPGLEQVLQHVTSWPRPFVAGSIRVYANPDCH